MNFTNPESSVEPQPLREQKEASVKPPVWVTVPSQSMEQVPPPVESASVEIGESSPQFSPELSFVCLLIPRFSDHYLVGDIIEALTEWMKQISISYGWRLDAISIRPGYIQWVIRVQPNTSPAQFMRLIRRHTSQKIFEDFPRFKQKNVSGEFWAPGNYVVPGNQLQIAEQVNEFILQTRRYQGMV